MVEDPLSQAVPTNGSLQLTCTTPNASHALWLRGPPEDDLSPIQGDSRVTTDGDTLELSSFHAIDHVGLYYCLITTETGDTVRSCPADISHASKQHALYICLLLMSSISNCIMTPCVCVYSHWLECLQLHCIANGVD